MANGMLVATKYWDPVTIFDSESPTKPALGQANDRTLNSFFSFANDTKDSNYVLNQVLFY